MPIFPLMIAILAFVFGVVILTYSSEKAVEHSMAIASAWRISPILIGLLFVSVGTDLPEIMNSIVSSALGHGDINVGDSLGSAFTQITLILGIIALLAKGFKVDRKEIAVIGTCEVLALVLAITAIEDGYISRINALFLVLSWALLIFIGGSAMKREYVCEVISRRRSYHFLMAVLGFVGVAASSYIIIQSIITLSSIFEISEYFISFFLAAIGTSLPELAVDLTAVRRREYGLAIGDIIGSSLVDATLSIGIGPLLFPSLVSGNIAILTGIYAVFASVLVILTLALRMKVDRKVGMFFIGIYLFSYVLFLQG